MSDNKKTKLNYMVVIPSKEYEPGNTPVEGPEDFDYTEQADENIESAKKQKSSMLHSMGNFALDISPAIIGVITGTAIGKTKAKKAISDLTKGADSELANKTADMITNSSKKQTKKLEKALEENTKTAKGMLEGKVVPKKALKTVLDNSKLEAIIGPHYEDDIGNILSKESTKSNAEIDKIFKNFIKKHSDDPDIIALLEAKDPNVTFGHSVRVSRLVKKIAEEAGLPMDKAQALADAALYHDMGKIAVPQRVLDSTEFFRKTKSGRDAPIKTHPKIGAEILEDADPLAARLARTHHPLYEDSNPTGSLDEGFVTIADLYDALTSPRSYKNGNSKEATIEKILPSFIETGETTQEFIDLLLRLDEKGKLDEFYPVDSDLAEAFTSMKKNALERKIQRDFMKKSGLEGLALGAGVSAALSPHKHLDKGGVGIQDSRMVIPTVTDIKEELFPATRNKKELIDEISRWYERGNFDNNPEAIKAIANTDFSKTKEIRKLWKYLDKVTSNQK